MMTITQQLNELQQVKADIKSALIAADIAAPGDILADYAELIRSLKTVDDMYAELFEIVPEETIEKVLPDGKMGVYEKWKYRFSEEDNFVCGNLIETYEPEDPAIPPRALYGKFSDAAEPENYKYKTGSTNVSLADYVDPVTKEFVYIVPNNQTNLCWDYNGALTIEHIYHLPTGLKSLKTLCNNSPSLKSVNFSGTNLSGVTNIQNMLTWTPNLKSVDLSPFAQCTNISGSFQGTFSNMGVTELNVSYIDISNVTTMTYCFDKSYELVKLIMTGWNFQNVTGISYFMTKCLSLTTVIGPIYNIKFSIDFKDAPFTRESALVFINALVDVGASRTITFNTTTYSQLTAEDIAIATERGWTVTSA